MRKQFIALLLAGGICLSGGSLHTLAELPVQALTVIAQIRELSVDTDTIQVGETTQLHIQWDTGTTWGYAIYTNDLSVVKLSDVSESGCTIQGLSEGTATIVVGNSYYEKKLTVTVKNGKTRLEALTEDYDALRKTGPIVVFDNQALIQFHTREIQEGCVIDYTTIHWEVIGSATVHSEMYWVPDSNQHSGLNYCLVTADSPGTVCVKGTEVMPNGSSTRVFTIYFTVDADGDFEESYQYTVRSVPGDVNADGVCSISDALQLQKWLLCAPDAKLYDTEAADLRRDKKLNVFDLVLLKQNLLQQASVVCPPNLNIHRADSLAELDSLQMELQTPYFLPYDDIQQIGDFVQYEVYCSTDDDLPRQTYLLDDHTGFTVKLSKDVQYNSDEVSPIQLTEEDINPEDMRLTNTPKAGMYQAGELEYWYNTAGLLQTIRWTEVLDCEQCAKYTIAVTPNMRRYPVDADTIVARLLHLDTAEATLQELKESMNGTRPIFLIEEYQNNEYENEYQYESIITKDGTRYQTDPIVVDLDVDLDDWSLEQTVERILRNGRPEAIQLVKDPQDLRMLNSFYNYKGSSEYHMVNMGCGSFCNKQYPGYNATLYTLYHDADGKLKMQYLCNIGGGCEWLDDPAVQQLVLQMMSKGYFAKPGLAWYLNPPFPEPQ